MERGEADLQLTLDSEGRVAGLLLEPSGPPPGDRRFEVVAAKLGQIDTKTIVFSHLRKFIGSSSTHLGYAPGPPLDAPAGLFHNSYCNS